MSADPTGTTGSQNSALIRIFCASALPATRTPSASRASTSKAIRPPAPRLDVQRGTVIALTVGVIAAAAAVAYAGSGAVVRAIESLHVSGLLVLVLLHLPIVAMMGFAWWLASGGDPPASPSRFLWARFVRDAASEVLPFLQFGGVVFGLRALGRGRAITVGAVSASIDGVIELAAKLPSYACGVDHLVCTGTAAPPHPSLCAWLLGRECAVLVAISPAGASLVDRVAGCDGAPSVPVGLQSLATSSSVSTFGHASIPSLETSTALSVVWVCTSPLLLVFGRRRGLGGVPAARRRAIFGAGARH